MLDSTPAEGRIVTRLTCVVNQRYATHTAEQLRATEQCSGFIQSGRCVRQFMRSRRWGLPGDTSDIQEFPMSIFRISVAPKEAFTLMRELVDALELNTPGRGSVFAQEAIEFRKEPRAEIHDSVVANPDENPASQMLKAGIFRDLALITAIVSEPGSGEQFAKAALELGTGVPLITLGVGTGIRDRLGLLRITIPPEKEIVQLAVPAHDAGGILRLLIESARMDRPGGGFIYQTPVAYGLTDPLMRIGRQQHAASIEQIIAALDDVKGGTTWRKRFHMENMSGNTFHTRYRHYCEVFFIAADGSATPLVAAAIRAGGGAATLSRVSRITVDTEYSVAAREQGVICVPLTIYQPVVEAILQAAEETGDSTCVVQVVDAPVAFSHQRARQK